MNSTKKFNTLLVFFLFIIAGAFTSSCSPIGSLLADSGAKAVAYDYIRAVPKKLLYGETDSIIPAKDVDVFGTFRGVEELIPIDNVKIKVVNYPGLLGEDEVPIPDNQTGIGFGSKGVKRVIISYKELETYYHIEVGDRGTGGGDNNWENIGGAGIKIIWK